MKNGPCIIAVIVDLIGEIAIGRPANGEPSVMYKSRKEYSLMRTRR